MKPITFVSRSLLFFKKQHLLVFMAALISTAVLTGALVIGDSVKFSLNQLVEQRLGKVEFAMVTGDRFVRSALANEMSHELNIEVASLLTMKGMAINSQNQNRISNVQILGVDASFWDLSGIHMPKLGSNEVIISQNVTEELSVGLGDELLLRVRNAEIIPVNAPFSTEEESTVALRVKIVCIANDDQLGRFSLRNNQLAPYNIFIQRDFLAHKLELNGLSNLVLSTASHNTTAIELNQSLYNNWELQDAGLSLEVMADSQNFELCSDRVFIDKSLSSKINQGTSNPQKILTYFVNSIRFQGRETPYSFVCAASEEVLRQAVADDEILVNHWLAADLQLKVGDSLQISYFVMGPLRRLVEKTSWLNVKGIVPVDTLGFDHTLMPAFPGMTEAGNCKDWESGIPIDLNKIRNKDELYWTHYRGTPKAYVSLDNGWSMWDNPFGNLTSIRLKGEGESFEKVENQLLDLIKPTDINLSFRPIRSEGKDAASGGVDFGQLFLSLSFFVIAAALLLLVMIYRLNVESRTSETGVLHALGFSRRRIIGMRMTESLPTLLLAALVGGFVGIVYNNLMLWGLNSVWNEAVHADMLTMKIRPQTIIIGVIVGVLVASLSIYFVTVRSLSKRIVSNIRVQPEQLVLKSLIFNRLLVLLGWGGALILVFYALYNSIAESAHLILIAGFLVLVGATSLVSEWLNPMGNNDVKRNNVFEVRHLIWKNITRNRKRSISVIWLLALGTFTIVVTGANRKTFVGNENVRASGTGGFSLWVENSVPVLYDLNTQEGAAYYGLDGDKMGTHVSFVQFHNLPGDDASCLNLNQVSLPQILGVDPHIFDSLGAFSFSHLLNSTSKPWLELTKNKNKEIIPAFADQTVIQWGLMLSIGDTLEYLNERGDTIHLLLVGGLNPSIFQGNILISDSCFMANFPSVGGSEYMLVQVPSDHSPQVSELLKNRLVDYGVEITSAPKRLAAFYSVTNTYLTIFMILGGLGVMLGTVGLGIVLMRNMQDRKHELAILKALGFTQRHIFRLVVRENLLLLVVGTSIGVFSALVGILPSFVSPAFQIPGYFLLLLVLGVFLNGAGWILLASRLTIKRKMADDLRNE